jgi:hypothetical protein
LRRRQPDHRRLLALHRPDLRIRTGSRARFAAPLAATALDELYADSRIVANTLPSMRYGSHERIMAGLLAKCTVVSESTPWLDRTMDRDVFHGEVHQRTIELR